MKKNLCEKKLINNYINFYSIITSTLQQLSNQLTLTFDSESNNYQYIFT